jgi:predicted Zn-dependent peptidase
MKSIMRIIAPALFALLSIALPAAEAVAQGRVYVRAEPGTPVVAVQILVAVGPADEPAEQAGITYLTARSVVEPARALLDSLGAHLEVEQQKDAVAFSLTAAPDVWEEASQALLVALFRDPVDSASVIRVRRALARELETRRQSPADALARELERAVYGEEHPWGRPSVGTPESVSRIGAGDVDAFLKGSFTPERSVVAVVGPVEAEAAVERLATHMGEGALRVTPPEAPQPVGEPVRTEYDAITTWVAASWRFGADADVEALRMLSKMALQQVSFGPSRRSVYDSRADVLQYPGGGEVRLRVVVPPREAEQWAGRLREAVGAFAAQPLSGPVFTERLRRYRGERLLELDTPEARAAAMARSALLGDPSATLADFLGLSAARLQRAAEGLEAPVIVFLGPSEGEGA